MSNVQWQVRDDVYIPCSVTSAQLPFGIYNCDYDSYSGITFTKTTFPSYFDFTNPVVDSLHDEINKFWNKGHLYKKFAMPHRRGVLLWGPPGMGKSTIVYRLGKQVVDMQGYVVIFPSLVSYFIICYKELRKIHPDAPILVVMEDLDEIENQNSTSDLTNCLDGVGSAEMTKTLFLATTNFKDSLPETLINRPSRFDSLIEVGPPDLNTRAAYFEQLCGNEFDVPLYTVAQDTDGLSFAHLKELFISVSLLNKGYEESLKRLKQVTTLAVSSPNDSD